NGSLFATGNFSDVWDGPIDAGWQYTVTAARDDQYGLQVYSANSLMVTWTERPVVVIDTAFANDADGRTNIGTVVTVFFHCEWSTNGSVVDSGTLYVNMTAYAINATGWIDFTWSSASVMRLVWSVTGVDANGIIQYDQRVASPSMTWDSLKISISVLDNRISVNENATILVSATYESDGVLFDGELLLNSTTFLYSTPSSHAYTVIAAFGDSHGITIIGTNDIAVVIWDRILVTSYLVTDNRCNIGTTQSVSLSAVHEYDGTFLTGARGLVYLNGTPMLWNPLTQVWFLDVDSATVARLSFVVSDIDDFVEGIIAFDSGIPVSIIWDSIDITITTGDQRIDIGENASVYVSAHYTFDNSIFDGILLLNDTIFQYSTVGRRGYTVVSAFGDTFDITTISTNDADYIIWDSVVVTIIVADNRINVGENATIWVSAIYAFDSSPYDGTITLNNTVYQYSIVGRRGYKASIASGGTHDITVIGYSAEEFVIWDSLRVYVMNYYPHINVGQNASIHVYALYDYDGKWYDGTLTLNDTVYILYTVGRKGYICESAFGDTYNITYIRFSGQTYVTWDSVTVTISVDENYISVGVNASISVTGSFDFDGTPYTGRLELNDSTYQYYTVGRRAYFCESAIPVGHSVTLISNTNVEYIIWDELEVFWSESERDRVDLNEAVDVMFRVRRSYSGSLFTDSDGKIYINDVEASFLETEGYWYISVTSSEVATRSYSITGHSDLVGGIVEITGETEFTCTTTWDLIYVSRAGVWGSAPAFDPEIDSPAGRTLQCELDWIVTVYFYLNYMSDDGALSDPNATVIVNGQNAIYISERQRWELNVTSQGIGIMQYVIEEILDQYGLTDVDQRGLYPAINWFPVRFAMSLAAYGGIGLAGVAVALFIRRTRRRVAALEEALGPERVMSMEEAELPVKVREEIIASLEWLRELQEQIPTLDTTILLSVKDELNNAYDLYTKAFGDIAYDEYLSDPGLRLKQALVKRVDVLIKVVDRELNRRA
ncbi:MAG: RHS repeat domain-containing protein, partial [Candidatus Thorarchaeota archaeon SMTZ1-45]